MDEGLQEDGGPALAGVQGALPHHGAGRKAEGGSLPFSSSEGGSEAGFGTCCSGPVPVNTHAGLSPVVSAKQRGWGSVRKGDEPPQSHHLRWHPSRAGSSAWPPVPQPVPQRGLGIEGAAGWDKIFCCPGAGREPQPEVQSPEKTQFSPVGGKRNRGE